MLSIAGRNVNDVYPLGLLHLRAGGVQLESRNGPVIEYHDPVSIKYVKPMERVLFDRQRDCNPFLHFFEPLWVLAGQKDTAFLAHIVKRFGEFSDNGIDFYGAYGHRMMYPDDQIREAINILKANPDCRRVVLQIRRPDDMFYKGKDQPCNTAVACKIREGKLNIHVFNRSNDYFWGMLGANMPQFSTLQEYLAGQIGCEVGKYHQTTDSMHVYTELNDLWLKVGETTSILVVDPYVEGLVKPYPMFKGVDDPSDFDRDLFDFFENNSRDNFFTPYFCDVVKPMWETMEAHKKDKTGRQFAVNIKATDWRLAVENWLEERE